jgi:4-hydroxybenzoate polyprenyltransferase
MGDGWRRADALARSAHPAPCVAVTVMATALAAATGRRPRAVAAVGAAVLTGHLSVGWHNDWVDAERDRRAHRADKPAAADPALRRAVAVAAGASLAACVPLSALSGRRAAVEHLGGVALGWAYNAGLKSTDWSWVPYAGAFGLLVSFVERGRPGHPPPPPWEVAAAALLGVGAHFANVLPDLETDAATGVRGLPHRLGRGRSVAASVALVLGASALATVRPGGWDATSLGLPVAAAVVAGGAAADRYRPGTLFKATLATAVLDAGLLLARVRRSR